MDAQEPITLVIVEDEWLLRTEIAEEAEEAGWRVLEFATAESALTLLSTRLRVDALVTDIRLGGPMTGWDVAEGFRASFPALPVVYASANPCDNDRMVAGGAFFSKPCLPYELLQACRALMASGPARRGGQ